LINERRAAAPAKPQTAKTAPEAERIAAERAEDWNAWAEAIGAALAEERQWMRAEMRRDVEQMREWFEAQVEELRRELARPGEQADRAQRLSQAVADAGEVRVLH